MVVAQQAPISSLRFLGEYALPRIMVYKNTSVGGLSGIDYDAKQNQYYLISDDRSAINPARFYTAKIKLSAKGIDSVWLTAVTTLKRKDGSTYPNAQQDAAKTPDPESIRYNPLTGLLLWTSEGERVVGDSGNVLENPGIFSINKNGNYVDTFPLPSNLKMQAIEKGPRQNAVLEGLTYADHYQTLYTNVEEPLYEDGPRADVTENDAYIRIFKYKVSTKQNVAQYAYKLSPVAKAPVPESAFKMNGASEILSVDSTHLLVMERSFTMSPPGFTIRIYLADLSGAEDIKDNPSLKATPPQRPVRKQLLLDMDDLHIYTDNIEGITFGPRLPNGHQTLICVADNNFKIYEKPQFLLFEVIP